VLAEQNGDRIQVEARRPGGATAFVGFGHFTSPSAKILATVPRSVQLVVRTGDGSVIAERLDGRLELRTGDGSIRVLEPSGNLVVETEDGSIEIEDASGHVEARTGDGSVRLTGTPEGVRIRSGDGSIMVRVRDGAVMSEDWMVVTADGSITLELPDDFDAEIEAEPGSDSRVRSEITFASSVGGTREQRTLRGTLGEGGHRLSLRTADGSIRLNRY